MTITRTLVSEHRLIEQVLNCLERMVERCASQRRLESAPARDAMVFFHGFTERCHYAKEDTELLPAMRATDISPERCLGCSMLQRRAEGRAHVEAMEVAIEPASRGDSTALKEFMGHARAYIELLLEYIADQEDCLFPMITRALSGPEKANLDVALNTACGDGEEQHACNTYIDLANRLADHFDVPHAMTADSPGSRRPKESSE